LAANVPSFQLWDQLGALSTELAEDFEAECLVLTGSLASGKWVSGSSDVDLLVITERARNLSHLDRFMLRAVNGVDVNVAVFTRDEVIEGVKSLSFFFIKAMEGVPTHGAEVFSHIKSIAEKEFKRIGLKRTKRGWTFES
jgi:predicted nucleotidyltransferase